MIKKLIIILLCFSFLLVSCTKLDEKLNGQLTFDQVGSGGGSANTASLLNGVYNSMQLPFQNHERVLCLWEMTGDALLGPTRGPDWDDNGQLRVLYAHSWTPDHPFIRNIFDDLNGVVFGATDLLQFNPTPRQAAEARFLRAMAQFMIFDGFNQLPYREPGGDELALPEVRKGMEAFDYIVSEIEDVLPDLPDSDTTIVWANKNAAKVLLMKCYLNKGAFANRAAPTFDAADMTKVITLADEIINSGLYSFSTNYFDNFAPANATIGKENIWVQKNTSTGAGEIRSRWHSGIHYNQEPGGWNGFTTLSDFYGKFEASDIRKGIAYPTGDPSRPNPGNRVNVGFLVGQQYDMKTGAPLQSRIPGQSLSYTPEVSLVETGGDLEVRGIRVYKYPVDWAHLGTQNIDNDFVYFRLADVLLMKAEALVRTNAAAAALPIVNSIRTNRGASALASVTLDNLLEERGRELYHEGWRRQDMIRFGKFLAPKQLKPEESDPKFLLFPIPATQIAGNPNLEQNPGY